MLRVKEWFADKKCRELKRNMSNGNVEIVLKETEKAMYVMVASETLMPITFWAPKSCIETAPNDERETKMMLDLDYKEAKSYFHAEMNGYK